VTAMLYCGIHINICFNYASLVVFLFDLIICCSFELGGATGAGILSQPRPPSTALFSLTDYTVWCDKVYAAIDCYCWVFSNGYIAPCEVFACE